MHTGRLYSAGIIGTGRIGFSLGFDKKREQPASHSMALAANARVKVSSGCDTNSGRLAAWAKYFPRAKIFHTADEFFAQRDAPDITVVAVNERAHLPVALEAFASGAKVVILEKPVALNIAEGLALKKAAGGSAAGVIINHERRFADDYRLAKTIVRDGGIGDIQSVRAVFCSGMAVYSPDAEESGAYSLLHDGTHLIDIIHFLLEDFLDPNPDPDAAGCCCAEGFGRRLKNPIVCARPVAEFSSRKGPPDTASSGISGSGAEPADSPRKKPVVRNLSVSYRLECGVQVSLELSGRSRFFDFSVELTGTSGRIKIGNGFAAHYVRKESKLYSGFYSLAKQRSSRFPKRTKYFSNMVQNAVDFLDGNAGIMSTLDDGLAALATIGEITSVLKPLCGG